MKKKGKFEYSYRDRKGYKINVFSYRGHDYEVQYNTEWTAREQHRHSQENIDIIEERRAKSKKQKADYSTNAMRGFELWGKFLDE